MSHRNLQTVFLGLLCLVVLFAAMQVAKAFFAPVVAAIVLGIVCAPITDRFEGWGLRRSAASFLVLLLFIALSVGLFAALEPTVTRAIENGPMIWREMTETIDMVRGAFAGAQELQESVGEALGDRDDSAGEGDGTDGDDDEEEDTDIAVPGLLDALAYAPSVTAAVLIFLGTFYFYLVGRTDLYDQIDASPLNLTTEVLCRAEARVSRYFLTITMINASFGVLVGLVMFAIGMPQPLLWGIAAFLLNFILYLGPACLALALLLTGIVAFDGVWSFIPPALYIAMNMTEGQFVTPALVGRHMKINPLLVFLSLIFWLWLWGPIGGVVAIPVLVWLMFVLGRLGWDDSDSEPKSLSLRSRFSSRP